MDKECGMYQVLEINLTAGNGAEKIIQEIAASPLRDKLILRDDKFLGRERYGEHLVNYLEFFTPEEGLADTAELLEELFPTESPDAQEPRADKDGEGSLQGAGNTGIQNEPGMSGQELVQGGTGSSLKQEAGREKGSGLQGAAEQAVAGNSQEQVSNPEIGAGQGCRVLLFQELAGRWKEGGRNPRIYLKVVKRPFQIPFVLELIPFVGSTLPLQEKALESVQQEVPVTYRMFTAEEYLSRGFYHIMDDLELVYSLSWYMDIYSILTGHVIEGRKVSQSFGQLLLEHAIPRLIERLEIISSFETYGYMQKRWENFCRRLSNASQPRKTVVRQEELADGANRKEQLSEKDLLMQEGKKDKANGISRPLEKEFPVQDGPEDRVNLENRMPEEELPIQEGTGDVANGMSQSPEEELQLQEGAEDKGNVKGKPPEELQRKGETGQGSEDKGNVKGKPPEELQRKGETGQDPEDKGNVKGKQPEELQREGETGQKAEETGDLPGEAEYPEWGQVIQLLVKFFSPVIEAASRDELFIGDWMPQFGKYLG